MVGVYYFHFILIVSELADSHIKTCDQLKGGTDSSATHSASLKVEGPEPTQAVKSE